MKLAKKTQQRKETSSPRLTGPSVFVFLLSAIFSFAWISAWADNEIRMQELLVPSYSLAFLSAFSFLRCGKTVVNASSVTSLGILLFGGFAGVYTGMSLNDQRAEDAVRGILIALAILFAFQVSLLAASPSWVEEFNNSLRIRSESKVNGLQDIFGLGAIAVCSIGVVVGFKSYVTPLGILGVFILVDSKLNYRGKRTKVTRAMVFASFLMALYYQFLFDGFGRLVLAVLATGIVVLFSLYVRTRILKVIVLVGSLIALPILALQRLRFLEETRGTAPLESEGLGSVVGPLVSFGQLIEARLMGLFEASMGATLFDTLTLWVPRAWWPEKPQGFGFDIVKFTQPHLVGNYGFTDAAMFGGELVWNFGIIGAFISIPVVSYCIFMLNKGLFRVFQRQNNRTGFIARIALVVASSALLHYVWAGTYTYLIRIFIILVFLAFLKFLMLPLGEKRG